MNAARAASPGDALDRRFMLEALVLAEQGRYSAAPNPAVGCVIVAGDAVVGRGAHRRAGEPHAEIEALAAAGASARGATAYVTLEPCNHHGRTPPCSEALIAAGVARVVYAVGDGGAASGGGRTRLEQAGIVVHGGVRETAAAMLMQAFLDRQQRARPRIRVKLAMSLDGAVALANGESQWITGPAARADVQRLRAESCAIVTGIGTVLADDPSLNVRDERFSMHGRQPDRVVLDRDLRMPVGARMLALAGTTHVLGTAAEAARTAALAAAGAHITTVPAAAVGVDMGAVEAFLRAQPWNQLLVEAGPRVTAAFLAAGLFDELLVYIAPKLLGADARGAFALPSPALLAHAYALRVIAERRIGDDLLVTFVPREADGEAAQ